jgi:hypothetical protein
MSESPVPSFERSEILRPMLDHLEINDSIVLHGLQQGALAKMVAIGREAGVTVQHVVFTT